VNVDDGSVTALGEGSPTRGKEVLAAQMFGEIAAQRLLLARTLRFELMKCQSS